jgi:hypothetical protein
MHQKKIAELPCFASSSLFFTPSAYNTITGLSIAFIFCFPEPGDPFALITRTASAGAHLPEEPFKKAGRKVVRNIS